MKLHNSASSFRKYYALVLLGKKKTTLIFFGNFKSKVLMVKEIKHIYNYKKLSQLLSFYPEIITVNILMNILLGMEGCMHESVDG